MYIISRECIKDWLIRHFCCILDWNITNTGMEYDVTSQKVFVHLKWSLPFNHSEVSQHIVWNNVRHIDHVDAGRVLHVSKTEGSNTKVLQLRPFSQYNIYVSK